MHITKINRYLYLIDLEVANIRNFFASYVLKGKQVAIIESGPTASISNLIEGLKALNVNPDEVEYVAVSHIHLDHGGGVGTLFKYLPKAKVIVHQRGAPHLVNPEKLWQQSKEVLGNIAEIYGKPEPVPEDRILVANDGTTINLGNSIGIQIVETLGHASHHLSYYEPLNQGIFPGDAAGIYLNEIDTIVPTTPAPFRLDIALASLEKLVKLKPKVLYYSHFGKAPNAIVKLQTYAKQIKLWAKIAKESLENGESLETTRKRIVESDVTMQRAKNYIEKHPIMSETVMHESLQGFIDFVEKFKAVPQ